VYENVDKIHEAQTRKVYWEQGIALSGSKESKAFLDKRIDCEIMTLCHVVSCFLLIGVKNQCKSLTTPFPIHLHTESFGLHTRLTAICVSFYQQKEQLKARKDKFWNLQCS
jgi:hypothetical protein